MIRRAAITLALACAATMAQATPPDMIHIEDELFGFSPNHVYLLRKSHDNLGLYSAYVRNVALVAIDRHTGDEQIWPVWRIRSVPDQDKDPDGIVSKVTDETPPGAVDPIQILREAGGIPAIGIPPVGSMYLIAAPNNGNDFAMLGAFDLDDGTHFAPDQDALTAGVSAALDRFAAMMGDYDRFGPLETSDLLAGTGFTSADCLYAASSILPAGAETPPANLVQVFCPAGGLIGGTEGDEAIEAALWMMILPEGAR